MNKVFPAISLGIGLAAGQLGKKLFQLVWGKFDDEEAPKPKHREVDRRKLAIALLIQGAILTIIKGFTDHGLRHAWTKRTGEWPGAERPEDE